MWQTNFVETDTIRLHYTRTGESKPPMVLLHGLTDLGRCWEPVAGVLEASYDVIMVDARGHGLSGVPETDYAWLSHAEDVRRVIEGLQLEKPIVMGHSMGALSALLFAAAYPDLPRAILLEDPPPMWMPSSTEVQDPSQREQEFRERISGLKGKSAAELIASQRQVTPRWSDAELDPWAESKLRVSPNVCHIFRSNRDYSNEVKGVTCPVLLITADPEQGAIVTPEAAQRLQSLVPQVQVGRVDDAGHSIRRDQFDAYMGVVQDFLKSL